MGILLRTLYPIAPHITHVLWVELGYAKEHGELLDAAIPQPAAEALRLDEVEIVVQVNGKLRGRLRLPADVTQETALTAALADEHIRKFVGDQPLRKVVFVRGKLLNLVAAT
jgi:leucyl-tRNA synthetase